MMKRYINMPLKKALPLLFIGALLLAGTTGCASLIPPVTSGDPTKQTTETGLYQGHEVHTNTTTFKDGDRTESVTVEGLGPHVSGCTKWFDKNGLLMREIYFYPDGHTQTSDHKPPIKDPNPGLLAVKVLVDYANDLADLAKDFGPASTSGQQGAVSTEQPPAVSTEQQGAVPWSVEVTLKPYDPSAVASVMKKADEDARASAAAGVPTYG